MTTQFYSIITNYGEQAIAKAVANNTPVPLKTMAIGDGNGRPTTPNANQTTLINEVYRAEITDLLQDQENHNQVIAELLVPETVGGFTVREVGIFDEHNKLIAVANCPENYKPVLEQGSGKVQYYRIVLRVSSNDAVTLSINNNIVYATRIEFNEFVNNLGKPDGFKLVGECESIAQLRTIEPTEDQQRILVKSYYAGKNLGGGVFYADLSDTQTADNAGTVIVTSGGNRWKRIINEHYININNFGATGKNSAIDTKAILDAANFSIGKYPLFIPYPEIEFNNHTNVQGCKIIGCNTVISGDLRGHNGLDGVLINQEIQQNTYHINSATDEPTVGVYKSLDGRILVYIPKQSGRPSGLMVEFAKNVTTTSNSLGGKQELLRATTTHNLSYAAFYYQSGDLSGNWRNKTRFNDEFMTYKGSVYQKLTYIQGEYGSSINYTLKPSDRDYTNLAYLSTVGGSETVEVYVNGDKVRDVNANSESTRFNIVKININKHQNNLITIKIKNQGVLNLVGINFDGLNELSPDAHYDEVLSFKPDLKHYITNKGANDYAILESKSNLWGGSYHGGEELLSEKFIDLENQNINFNGVGHYKAVTGLKIIQDTRINFSSEGGDDIYVNSITSFCFSGVEFHGVIKGDDAVVKNLFTTMNCVNQDFNEILFPRNGKIDISGENEFKLGNNNKVIYHNSSNNSIVISEFSLYPVLDNNRGGAYINPAPGAYNKLYYGHINGEQVIRHFAFSSRRIFK